MAFCECGCGMLTKFRNGIANRFVNHHYTNTKEHKINKSKEMMGNKYRVGFERTEEWRKNHSEFMMGKKYHLGHRHVKEWERNHSEETNRKNAESHKGKKHTIKARQKMRKHQKELWADPIHHKNQQSKMSSGNNAQRPNKLEIKLRNLLDFLYPDEWKYVGDGKLIIAGKNPDFINVNGKKQIIEVWGDYWHKGQNPEDRITVFKPYGYETLIIWEHELKNQSKLIGRINKFAAGEGTGNGGE